MSEVLTRLSPALADRYRIEREVGSGAMATVYLAHDLKHDREVALKVLRPELAAVLGVERFLNEIRITARLDHPHILTLIDSGSANGFLYYVLPFVRGESMRDRLRREKQLSVDDALTITRQVGSALEYAHRQGVVHRDIKPENILIHEGEAMLADFGIALAVKEAGGHRLTETGRSLGTPQYMSPEQATGERTLDARSDVYSLAAVLYEMLAGEPPHTGPNLQAIIAKLLTERPIRLRVLRDTVPEGIDAAVAKALAIVPADRYANAGEFVRALAIPATPPRARWQWRRLIPVAIGAGAVTAALATALVVGRRSPPPPAVDRIQLTATGNATVPSLSPDGSRLAFGEKECDAEGYCTYRLVIQDVDGTGRLVITGNIAVLWSTEWTRDGRYLLYSGSYGAERWGMFAISTLGGTPRYLGCCSGILLSGDTVLVFRGLASGDTLAWVRRVSARGGQPLDSIPIRHPGLRFNVIPTTYKDRLLVLVRRPNQKARELRLIDYKGAIIDRSIAGFDVGDRAIAARWMAERSELLVAVQHEPEGDEYDFLRIRASASRIEPMVDTVAERIGMGGWYDVSPDGARLVYTVGPVETSIWASDRNHSKPTSPRPLFTSTTVAFARVSPAGDRMLVGRQVVSDGRRRFQLFITPFSSWEESQVSAPLEDFVGVQWTADGNRIVYANGVGTRLQVVEVDTSGRHGREIANVDRSMASGLYTLRDGGVALVGPDRRSIALLRRRDHADMTLRAPQWLGYIEGLSASPDGVSLGILGWDRASDSAVVGQVNLNTGTIKRLATLGAEDLGFPTWLNDGSIVFDIQEARGAQALYTIRPGGRAKRLGALPHAPAAYSVSADGRRLVVTSRSDKKDVYMIRNFGDFLKR
jgi:tRNA A-37 threonylcarbamoyl transferase component Bud32/Tol biopolymer transport system component